MVSVTDFALRIEGLFERLEAAVDRFVESLILLSSEVSRWETRFPSVVSN